jgi:phage shock protein A
MGILIRAIRIFKADVHGVMDRLEDQKLLLKQHLRDMAEALNLKEAELNKIRLSRQQMQHDFDQYRRRLETLERDLAVALQKNKDDIARMLIRKIKPMESLHDEFAEGIRHLDEEYSYGRDQLDQQRLRYDRLKQRSIDLFRKTPIQELQKIPAEFDQADNYGEFSEEEIELELLKRKAVLGIV